MLPIENNEASVRNLGIMPVSGDFRRPVLD